MSVVKKCTVTLFDHEKIAIFVRNEGGESAASIKRAGTWRPPIQKKFCGNVFTPTTCTIFYNIRRVLPFYLNMCYNYEIKDNDNA